MLQKRMFKVISPIEKRGGGQFWMRVGSAFTNKDDSINIYLDAWPKNFQLQLRELDEEDLRKRESPSSLASSSFASSSLAASSLAGSVLPAADDSAPF